MDTQKNQIVAFPEYEKLEEEVKKLRTELTMIVLERDELLYVECKNIDMEYMLALGNLEYRVYEAQCKMLRLKRKMELIQMKVNRQEKISVVEIDENLDKEFSKYQQELKGYMDKMNKAIKRSKSEALSDEETKELKKLHPDLHPGISQEEMDMFSNAVTAYKDGDLVTIRIISAMITDHLISEGEQDPMKKLINDKERLKELLDNVKKKIEKIKEEYPYNVKVLLQDTDKIEKRSQSLQISFVSIRMQLKLILKKSKECWGDIMNELIKTDKGGLMGLIHGKNGAVDIPKRFFSLIPMLRGQVI